MALGEHGIVTRDAVLLGDVERIVLHGGRAQDHAAALADRHAERPGEIGAVTAT